MVIVRFQCDNSSNGNLELLSIDGIKAEAGQNWALSVGSVSQRMPINGYIPTIGVEVLFSLVPAFESVTVDQGRLLEYVIKQNFQVR